MRVGPVGLSVKEQETSSPPVPASCSLWHPGQCAEGMGEACRCPDGGITGILREHPDIQNQHHQEGHHWGSLCLFTRQGAAPSDNWHARTELLPLQAFPQGGEKVSHRREDPLQQSCHLSEGWREDAVRLLFQDQSYGPSDNGLLSLKAVTWETVTIECTQPHPAFVLAQIKTSPFSALLIRCAHRKCKGRDSSGQSIAHRPLAILMEGLLFSLTEGESTPFILLN